MQVHMKSQIKKMAKNLIKEKLFLLCGLVMAFFEVLGLFLSGLADGGKEHIFSPKNLLFMVAAGIMTTILATIALYFMWHGGRKFVKEGTAASRLLLKPGFYWVTILLCWLPCYLAYFPAIYSYDGEPQLIQYTEHAFNNHHPIAHTLFIGVCYDAGRFLQQRFNCPLDGMAIYAFLQMILLSGAFACGFAFLIRRKASGRMLIATLIWCIIFPVHPLMAVSTTKDTFFTAFFIMDFFLLVQVMEGLEKPEKKEMIQLCVVNLCLMLFRKNSLYIQIILLAIFLIAALCCFISYRKLCRRGSSIAEKKFSKKNNMGLWVRLAAVTLISIVAFRGAEQLLLYATDAEPGEAAEALSIPLQQLARTYKSNGEQMKAEDLEILTDYLPEKGMENYRPYISDGVKMYFNNDLFRENPAEFFKIYLRLACEYPGSYLMAFAYQTMGDWFLTDISHCLVYQDWWRDRTGYLITDATPVFSDRYVKKENLLPAVRNIYEAVATDCVHQRFLPLKILFAPALYCFLILFAGVAFIRQKRYMQLVPWAAVIIYFLTVVAGPCVLIRYIYPFMALMPFLAFQVLREDSAL